MTPAKHAIKGLYAITPDGLPTIDLVRRASLIVQNGARVLQYRNKSSEPAERLEQAEALRELTRRFSVSFIINDDIALAQRVNADGVHLGENDGQIRFAREQLGTDKLIGASCYNRLELAQAALAGGADYVAFGAFFPSGVKPEARSADISLLREARAKLTAPIVAIGGITAQNGATLLRAGADALAVISAVFSVPDVARAASDFYNLFEKAPFYDNAQPDPV